MTPDSTLLAWRALAAALEGACRLSPQESADVLAELGMRVPSRLIVRRCEASPSGWALSLFQQPPGGPLLLVARLDLSLLGLRPEDVRHLTVDDDLLPPDPFADDDTLGDLGWMG